MNPEQSNYDLEPIVTISSRKEDCAEGWEEICAVLRSTLRARSSDRQHVAFECYPGVLLPALTEALQQLFPGATILEAATAYKEPADLEAQFVEALSNDPVFAFMRSFTIADYFDPQRLETFRHQIEETVGLVFIVGTGGGDILPNPDMLLHLGVTRWELQRRQRLHQGVNLGLENFSDPPARLYKNAYFLDWRVADRLRHQIFGKVNFFLDLDLPDTPRMIDGDTLRQTIKLITAQPFRVIPFFDPGPWGGTVDEAALPSPGRPCQLRVGLRLGPRREQRHLGFWRSSLQSTSHRARR